MLRRCSAAEEWSHSPGTIVRRQSPMTRRPACREWLRPRDSNSGRSVSEGDVIERRGRFEGITRTRFPRVGDEPDDVIEQAPP